MNNTTNKKQVPKVTSLWTIAGGSFLLGALVGGWVFSLLPAGTVSLPTSEQKDERAAFTVDNLLIRLNEARLEAGLAQLSKDTYLSQKSLEILEDNCPVTSHKNFDTLYDRGEFKKYSRIGNILNSNVATPKQSVEEFLKSPTHKDILLTKDAEFIGIGVRTSPVNCVSVLITRMLP
jgi:uncharacterized protein YkwD